MKLIENNVIEIAGYELDGFSYVNIPENADYAIVKKEGETGLRIIDSSGKISKPFIKVFTNKPAGFDVMSGLTLIEDNHPERPYIFVDNTGAFSDRYADVSCVGAKPIKNKETGRWGLYDRANKKFTKKNIVSVKEYSGSKWISISKEFMNLRMDKESKVNHFYCMPDTDIGMMLKLRYSDGSHAYAMHFANEKFAKGIRARFEKQFEKILEQRENEYYNSSKKEQKEIEQSGKYFLVEHLDKAMKDFDKIVACLKQETENTAKQNIRDAIEGGELHERVAELKF